MKRKLIYAGAALTDDGQPDLRADARRRRSYRHSELTRCLLGAEFPLAFAASDKGKLLRRPARLWRETLALPLVSDSLCFWVIPN